MATEAASSPLPLAGRVGGGGIQSKNLANFASHALGIADDVVIPESQYSEMLTA
jgi:hypothetical protein